MSEGMLLQFRSKILVCLIGNSFWVRRSTKLNITYPHSTIVRIAFCSVATNRKLSLKTKIWILQTAGILCLFNQRLGSRTSLNGNLFGVKLSGCHAGYGVRCTCASHPS